MFYEVYWQWKFLNIGTAIIGEDRKWQLFRSRQLSIDFTCMKPTDPKMFIVTYANRDKKDGASSLQSCIAETPLSHSVTLPLLPI